MASTPFPLEIPPSAIALAARLCADGAAGASGADAWDTAKDASGNASGGVRVIHREPSEFGRLVVEEDSQGVRSLAFEPGVAVQSVVVPGHPLDLRLAYARVAMAALALHPGPSRALLLGLGGGSIPMFIQAAAPLLSLDVVEIDQAVVGVAERFMGFRPSDGCRVHAMDGRRFVEESPASTYDLVFLDAYGALSIPPRLASLQFLGFVRRILRTGGLCVSNVWGPAFNGAYGRMLATHLRAFGEGAVHAFEEPGSGNRIFICPKDGERLDFSGALVRAEAMNHRLALPFDLAASLRRGPLPRTLSGDIPEEELILDRE